MKKIFGILAMVAIAGVTFVGCNKEVGNEVGPNDAKKVATVRQTIVISFSEDLRAAADIDLSAYDLKGEKVVVLGALASERLEDVVSYEIGDLTFPCKVEAAYQLAPKSTFVPEIGKEYDFARTMEVKVELLNKNGKVLATKSDTHLRTTAKVEAKEDTDWSIVLGGSGSVDVTIEKESDGSYEIED